MSRQLSCGVVMPREKTAHMKGPRQWANKFSCTKFCTQAGQDAVSWHTMQVSAFRLGQSWWSMGGQSVPIVGWVRDLPAGRHAANSVAERVGQESSVLQECETKMIISWSGVSVMN